tara:strand:- start:277 stop:639 length:363 start_codon:yes stop_codon:yes gene_type:complete
MVLKNKESIKMRLTKLSKIVYQTLVENKESRNDDNILIFDVWNKLSGRNIWEVPMGDFFFILKDKWKLPNEQSIRRMRRKVQQHYIETRGSKYNVRLGNQNTIKSELRIVAAESTNPNYS